MRRNLPVLAHPQQYRCPRIGGARLRYPILRCADKGDRTAITAYRSAQILCHPKLIANAHRWVDIAICIGDGGRIRCGSSAETFSCHLCSRRGFFRGRLSRACGNRRRWSGRRGGRCFSHIAVTRPQNGAGITGDQLKHAFGCQAKMCARSGSRSGPTRYTRAGSSP